MGLTVPKPAARSGRAAGHVDSGRLGAHNETERSVFEEGRMSTTTPRLRKGEATRRLILERAAPVFNQRGYAGASMSELVEATGIEKGGIYNHFGSKEDLAVEAFDYSISLIVDGYAAVQEGKVGLDRLQAIIEIFGNWSGHPLVAGGGPNLNTAIEAGHKKPPPAERPAHPHGSVPPLSGAAREIPKMGGEV